MYSVYIIQRFTETNSPVVSQSDRELSRGNELLCKLLIVRTMRGTICGFDEDLNHKTFLALLIISLHLLLTHQSNHCM